MAYQCDGCGQRIDEYEGTCSSCQGDPMEDELFYGDPGPAPRTTGDGGAGGIVAVIIVVLFLIWICRG